jgi:hypothetical protein
MKLFGFICLVLTCLLGNSAEAQRPTEWRPNVAEDNKAATWPDTAQFIVGTYNKFASYPSIELSAPISCRLRMRVSWQHDDRWYVHFRTYEMSRVDPLSISLQTQGDLSIVSFTGTNNQVFGEENSLVYAGSQLSDEPACSERVRDCKTEKADLSNRSDSELRLNDPEMSKRVARALMHAALLCGGTKAVSPF